jgi:hypothetical protein
MWRQRTRRPPRECAHLSPNILRLLRPKSTSTQLNLLKMTRRSAVLIKCSNEEGRKKVKEELEKAIGEEFKIANKRKMHSEIQTYDANEQDFPPTLEDGTPDKEKILQEIKSKNSIPEGGFIFVKYACAKKGQINLYVDNSVKTALMESGRVKFGLNIIKFKDVSAIVMCYRCCGYGHTQHVCKQAESAVVCADCSGNHEKDKCKETRYYRCVNCVNYNAKLDANDPGRLDVNHGAGNKKYCDSLKMANERHRARLANE